MTNQHVSITVYMMPGKFDDRLRWPFKGDVVIKLLSQGGKEPSAMIDSSLSQILIQ